MNGAILYFCHDNPAPAGGVLTIYNHVKILNKHGIKSFIVHTKKGFKLSWFSLSVPILYAEGNFTVSSNDLLMFPEDYGSAIGALRSLQVRKYIFCQNHYYIFKSLKEGENWDDLGIEKIICSSDVIRDFLCELFGYSDLPVIHYGFDSRLFKPRPKKMQIAYMPRKRPFEIEFVRKCFYYFWPEFREVPWVPIHGKSQEQVARILGQSEIFLSMSLYEGFGMPPVEAMMSGCIVVGFHGDGGREYARDENGFWCQEGDIIDCARKLGYVLKLYQTEPERIESVRAQAMITAQHYHLENQEKEVIQFWQNEANFTG